MLDKVEDTYGLEIEQAYNDIKRNTTVLITDQVNPPAPSVEKLLMKIDKGNENLHDLFLLLEDEL